MTSRAYCFSGNHNHRCPAWPELTRWTKPIGARSGPILQHHREAGLQVLDLQANAKPCRNLELQLHGTALQLLRRSIAGVSLSGPNGW